MLIVQIALYGFVKDYVSSTTTLQFATAKLKGSREDNPDAKGLHLVWLDNGACLLPDEPLGLGSAVVTYDSKLDDGYCIMFIGYRLLVAATKLDCRKTDLAAQPAHSG